MKAYLEIELPKSCCECDIKSWDGEDDVCPFSGISALSIGRQDDCPLVYIPPHGDLIDRDSFIEFIKTHWDSYDQWFVEQLEARPTIIPAEESET